MKFKLNPNLVVLAAARGVVLLVEVVHVVDDDILLSGLVDGLVLHRVAWSSLAVIGEVDGWLPSVEDGHGDRQVEVAPPCVLVVQ